MDKKKKNKYQDDYSLRTLSYYQREGGIYNDLITILQRIRTEKWGRKLIAPNKILNIASEALEVCLWHCQDDETKAISDCGFEELAWFLYGGCVAGPLGGIEEKDELVILSVLCVLLSRYPEFQESSIPQISEIINKRNSSIFKPFEELVKRELRNNDNQLESLKNQLAMKDALLRKKDEQLAKLISLNYRERRIDFWQRYSEKSSGIDSVLSLDAILEWVSNRQHYTLTDQVFVMLKELSRKVATDEEYNKIRSLENDMLAKYKPQTIVNNNMGIGSNILTGIAQNPMMPMGYDQNQILQKFIEFINNGARRENKD